MEKDGHIRLLPIHIANKIAAGEVVERPASVVKELLENSIDAGATRIEVTVTAGGRKLIEIRDNGCGMGKDDALLCIERQATSKIREVEDIEKIDTLGFRGEAVPSIASVSRFSIKTRKEGDDAGTEISILGGTVQEVKEVGAPVGTTIAVRDLFFNVPVRKKFLRTYQTEQAHIKSVFTIHALAHPEIGLTFNADGRTLAQLPPGGNLKERMRDLFGSDFLNDLRPVSYEQQGVRVTGYAGHPGLTRNDRSEQYIFVNRRPATAPVIAYALKEAYPPMEGSRKPVVVLFIDLPPEEVDVNVHPTKREVRFNKPSRVREAMINGISQALGIQRQYRRNIPDLPPPEIPPLPAGRGTVPFSGPVGQREWPADVAALRSMVPNAAGATRPNPRNDLPFPYPAPLLPERPQQPLPRLPTPEAPIDQNRSLFTLPNDGSPWSWSRVIGQVANRYILLETDSGYVTVEPQAARERILYERLIDHDDEKLLSQKLLIPETVRLPPKDAARLRKHLETIRSMGFAVEDFGNDHFIVEALPEILGDVSCRELLADIARDLENAGTKRGANKWLEEIIARAVCKTISGTPTRMDNETAQRLVDTLAKTRMPYTCPRGRPTMIFTSYRELERKFSR